MVIRTNRRRKWLITTIIWSSFVIQVHAFSGGTGEPKDPYQISTAAQLVAIGCDPNLLDKHFILLNDIDLDPNLPGGRAFSLGVIAADTNDKSGWQGIPFGGSFHGRGHTIKNLVMRARSPRNAYVGLFGWIGGGGVVADLVIERAQVETDGELAGVLAGENAGRVINCRSGGRVSAGKYAGGLVGRNVGVLINCQTKMEFVRGRSNIGGLVGANDPPGSIVRCRATSREVSAWRFNAGGLAGGSAGYIVGSCASGRILALPLGSGCGGLVGDASGIVINCCANSGISASGQSRQVGGLVGLATATIVNCFASGSVTTGEGCNGVGGLIGDNFGDVVNSYATGKISAGADSTDVGGLVGCSRRGEVRMSFWDVETSGMIESADGTGLNTALMQWAGTFLEAGWDFVDEHANGAANPWRMPEGGGYPVLTLGFDGYDPPALAGHGTADAPYRIASPEDLGAIWRHDPSACYQLISNIDLAGIRWTGAPIPAFNGTFDGAGFIITHLTVQARRSAGLFGVLYPVTTIMNLGIGDANVMGGHRAWGLGLLAGLSYSYRGNIVSCYATGRLCAGRQSSALGGLIGWNSQVRIANCYAIADVSCGEESTGIGGLLGQSTGTVEQSYGAGSVVVPDPNGTCGGLIGVSWKGTLVDCYFLALSDGGGPDNNLGTPLTNVRMKQQASFNNWDFEHTWMISEGKDYPRLWWENVKRDN